MFNVALHHTVCTVFSKHGQLITDFIGLQTKTPPLAYKSSSILYCITQQLHLRPLLSLRNITIMQ